MTLTANKTRRPSRFTYVKPTAQDVNQRIQRHSFDEALRQAYGGNLEPLHEYLRAFLLEDNAKAITEFHRRRLRHDLIKRVASPERRAENHIAGMARWRLKMRRKLFGRLPSGALQEEIKAVAESLLEDFHDADPERINYRRILNMVRRGTKQRL